MSLLVSLLAQFLHAALILVAAPTLVGVRHWLSSRLVSRSGTPLSQPLRELAKSMRKQPILAENASGVVRAAPLLVLTSMFLCALLVPSFCLGMTLAPFANLLTIAALLAFGRVSLVLATMDAGTGEGGVAAWHSVRFGLYADSALWVAIFALALLAGSFNLDLMIGVRQEGTLPGAATMLAVTAVVLVAFGEVTDAPLDAVFSARDLALIRAAAALRVLVWFNLAGVLALPWGIAPTDAGPVDWLVGLTAWIGRLALFTVLLALVQRVIGTSPPRFVPVMMGIGVLLCIVAVALTLANTVPA